MVVGSVVLFSVKEKRCGYTMQDTNSSHFDRPSTFTYVIQPGQISSVLKPRAAIRCRYNEGNDEGMKRVKAERQGDT
jgi:hypothetical protein